MLYLTGFPMRVDPVCQDSNSELVPGGENHFAETIRNRYWRKEMYITLSNSEKVVYIGSAGQGFSVWLAVTVELVVITFLTWALKDLDSLHISVENIIRKEVVK